MIPSFVLKKTLLGNGFQKESVLEYIDLLKRQIQEKETALGIPHQELPADDLKPVKFGGFEKESVLQYIDILYQKLIELETAQHN